MSSSVSDDSHLKVPPFNLLLGLHCGLSIYLASTYTARGHVADIKLTIKILPYLSWCTIVDIIDITTGDVDNVYCFVCLVSF